MLPAGCVIGHSEWTTRKQDVGPFITAIRANSGAPQNGDEDMPLNATDAQTVWNNRVEVPAAQRDIFVAPVYSAEAMLLGANYWAAKTYRETVAQRATLALILAASTGGNQITEAELNAALDAALARAGLPEPPPTPVS